MRKKQSVTSILFILFVFFIIISANAQFDTSPDYSVEGNWVLKNNEKFFAKIAGYFYIQRLPEYIKMEHEIESDSAFKYICSGFNILMLPSWPLFSIKNGYQKLASENCSHPAFNIDYPNAYYKNIRSTENMVLMTQTTYMMDILRYAGLNNYKTTTGYFNRDNTPKKENVNWVLGPKDMDLLAENTYFSEFFGSKNSWGYFQLNISNGLMHDRGEFFWFLSDEPERNGNDWFLSADALRKISISLLNKDLNNICFISFGPVKYGNKYLFAKEYPNLIPPNNLLAYKKDYYFSYGNEYNDLKKNFEVTLDYYSNIGNVFGINDYSLINESPAYAGYFVDWIKERKGNVPVWIWVAPYLKSVDFSELRCQVFTAIIHGANGIGFWMMNQQDVSDPEQLYKAMRISKELEYIEQIIISDPALELMNQKIWSKFGESVHFTVKELDFGKCVIIAVNTSKSNTETFKFHIKKPYEININKVLQPLEAEIFY